MAQILIHKLKRHGWDEDREPETIEEDLLSYSTGLIDDENEYTVWEEWRLDGKIVKRGVHVHLKKGLSTTMEVQVG